ncbi:hypothetical protein HWV62_14172 [Athelia sp. TMB]|nr:hypothetical protein HWV62_14172 [Athelia sp. TMB]
MPILLTAALLVVPSYLLLVRSLRWRRYNAIHREFIGRDPHSLTTEEAQRVMQTVTMWDMPGLSVYSLSFALFKTYAIPSISKILAATKELSSAELVSKRYADTEILVASMVHCPVAGNYPFSETSTKNGKTEECQDPRAMIALARLNFLHSHYPIKNDDHIYTLSMFVLEPPRWAARYGWRSWSILERTSIFILWKEIGHRMGIKGIPETLDELETWSLAYEQEYMVPAETNALVAKYTVDELLHSVPTCLGIKAAAEKIVVCALEERVRIAMKQPAQPEWLKTLTHCLLLTSGPFQRYLCFPRRTPESRVPVPLSPSSSSPFTPSQFSHKLFSVDKNGVHRMHPNQFRAKPWYKPAGAQWMDRLKTMVGWYDCVPGPEWASSGYRLEEIGPIEKASLAHEQIMHEAERLQGYPVTGIWSLDGRKGA